MTTTDERLAALEERVALQTQTLRHILEGKLEGLGGAAGDLIALEGGSSSIAVNLGYSTGAYRPTVDLGYPGLVSGEFASPPQGVILHGSRSGIDGNPIDAEYLATARHALNEPNGRGWHATIGNNAIALHLPFTHWGENARGCSGLYLAVSFAQPNKVQPISDGQIRAFCWFFVQARQAWPQLPLMFTSHANLDGSADYGHERDGATDPFPRGANLADELRMRIDHVLAQIGIS